MPEKEPITLRDLVQVREFESNSAEYLQWKRAKVEQALRHADEHPDDFLTEREVWERYDIGY